MIAAVVYLFALVLFVLGVLVIRAEPTALFDVPIQVLIGLGLCGLGALLGCLARALQLIDAILARMEKSNAETR